MTGSVLPTAPNNSGIVPSNNFGLNSFNSINNGNAANDELIDEVKALKEKLVFVLKLEQMYLLTRKTTKILERVTPDGSSLQTSAV